jgi:hypothetical protein
MNCGVHPICERKHLKELKFNNYWQYRKFTCPIGGKPFGIEKMDIQSRCLQVNPA